MNKKSLLAFDRWDFLATRLLLGLIAVVAWAGGVVIPVVTWLRDEPLATSVFTGRTPAVDSPSLTAADGVTLSWPGDIHVSIPDADSRAWLISFLPGLLVAITATILVISLLRLVARIQAGDDLGRPALRTLRLIGLVLLIAPVLVAVADATANSVLIDAAFTDGSDLGSFTIDLAGPMIAGAIGLVCGAIAEAFGHMADDVEGLV